ncbi:NACHT domain-containing protein [Desulfosarcina cetonica]
MSVFDDVNLTSEAFFQEKKLLTISKNKYADYILRLVGTIPLYRSKRSLNVEDIYIPIKVSNKIQRDSYKSTDEIKKSIIHQVSGKLGRRHHDEQIYSPLEAIEKSNGGFLLYGDAGVGKSTLFKWITLEVARGKKIGQNNVLPFFFAASELEYNGKTVLKASEDLLSELKIGEPEKVIDRLLEHGRCMILIDGLDEAKNNFYKKTIQELNRISAKYPKSYLCLSTRPFYCDVAMPGFEAFEILPFNSSNRNQFIKNWYKNIDKNKGLNLISILENKIELLDLGFNPLLLSLICALFNANLNIPSDIVELYNRSIEVFLGKWDDFRVIERESALKDLSSTKRKVFVSWLAAIMHYRGRIVFTKDDIEQSDLVNRLSKVLRYKLPDAEYILSSLYRDFGILCEKAPGYYTFSHFTIHEYLVANYLIDNHEVIDWVKKYFNNEEWIDIHIFLAKKLHNADQYLKYIFKRARFDNFNDVLLLRVIWDAKPICSEKVQKEIICYLVAYVARAAKISISRAKVEYDECAMGEDETPILYIYFNRKLKKYYHKIHQNLIDLLKNRGIPLSKIHMLNSIASKYYDNAGSLVEDLKRILGADFFVRNKTDILNLCNMPVSKRNIFSSTNLIRFCLLDLIHILQSSDIPFDNFETGKNILFKEIEPYWSSAIKRIEFGEELPNTIKDNVCKKREIQEMRKVKNEYHSKLYDDYLDNSEYEDTE